MLLSMAQGNSTGSTLNLGAIEAALSESSSHSHPVTTQQPVADPTSEVALPVSRAAVNSTVSMVCVVNPPEMPSAVKLAVSRYRPIQPQPPVIEAPVDSQPTLAILQTSDASTQAIAPVTLQGNAVANLYTDGTKQPQTTVVATGANGVNQTLHLEQVQIAGYFCNICNSFYHCTTHCPAHTEPDNIILDSQIPSRARLTLPKQLYLQTSGILSGVAGVWTRTLLEKKTQFGPMIGKTVAKEDVDGVDISDRPQLWKIYQDNALIQGLNMSDEEESNWMMFVQRARSSSEQNLVAFLLDTHIFFMSTRSINPDTELLVWFSSDFCQLLGLPVKPEDGFSCTECHKKFLTANALERHKRYLHASTAGRKWQCHTCQKYFSSATKLSIHTLGHMGIKPHTCTYCNKQFTDASNLRGHLSIHTGERRFICSICGKAFRQKAHLNSHFLTHSGEKRLQCRYCDRWFARTSDLRQHEFSHTREKQFPCPTCHKVFYRLQTQKKHLKVHAGQRDYECSNCAKCFFTKYHMERHQKVCRGKDDLGGAESPPPETLSSENVQAQVVQFIAAAAASIQNAQNGS